MGALLLKLSLAGIISLVVAGVLVLALVIVFFVVFPFSQWWKAMISGVQISFSKLIAMKMRKVDLNSVVLAYITAKRSGLELDIADLETHVLAGGNIDNVVRAMISANKSNINLSMQLAMALDLAGKDVAEVVKNCIVPKIVDTPQVTAIAKDGYQITAKASITLITNIRRVIGGADENTIVLRVSEALSSTIGSATTHEAVMENPDVISDVITKKGLDFETAYQIVSIDIYEMTLGKNIFAEQRMQEAELEKKAMQTRLEARRLEAVALEQENKAKVQEMKAKMVESEAEVPKALAKALNEGKMNPVDYYDIQNLQADTNLRNVLSGKSKEGNEEKAPAIVKPKRNPFNF